jgi:ADP-ribose pyrophosphatase YjhB (NUDIX family)
VTRQYCYVCGQPTQLKEPRCYWCEHCQQTYYDNPRPCVDLFLFDDQNRILGGRRAFEPGKGKLDIPGGFLEFGESFEEGAMREIKEELGLTAKDYSAPQYFASYIADYPWGKETYQNVAVAYVARLKPGTKPIAGDDLKEAFFLEVADIDREAFGFPPQADLIQTAQQALERNEKAKE